VEVPGLLHKNVLEAAEVDRKPIPWCVQADATPGSAGRLAEVKGLMTSCLSLSPEERPKLPDLHRSVTVLQAAEAAEVRAAGSTGHDRLTGGSSRELRLRSLDVALKAFGCGVAQGVFNFYFFPLLRASVHNLYATGTMSADLCQLYSRCLRVDPLCGT
jgi:hypothetical protein